MSQNEAGFPDAVWDGSSPARPDPELCDRAPVYEDWDQAVAELAATQQYVLDRVAEDILTEMTNDNAGTLVVGTPVYLKSDGDIDKADADSTLAIAQAIGVVVGGSILTTANGDVQIKGRVTLTTAEWDAVAGTTGGLDPGAIYYVSATVGTLTATAPSTMGHFVKPVIRALSATEAIILEETAKIVP